MTALNPIRFAVTTLAVSLAALNAPAAFPASVTAVATTTSVCIALPKAQLGQGNNSPTDVSEPVRTTLGSYMAGPTVTLIRLDARIPVQIKAEAEQKGCNYVLQSSVSQKKAGSAGGFLKKLAPLATMMPMMGAMGGNMGSVSAMGAMAAQSMATGVAQAAAQSAQQEALAAMTGAQQSNVKRGDTITLEYTLTKLGEASEAQPETLKGKATQDGEDLLGPMLEQVATAVITKVTAV
jgi:hypothetical protein